MKNNDYSTSLYGSFHVRGLSHSGVRSKPVEQNQCLVPWNYEREDSNQYLGSLHFHCYDHFPNHIGFLEVEWRTKEEEFYLERLQTAQPNGA